LSNAKPIAMAEQMGFAPLNPSYLLPAARLLAPPFRNRLARSLEVLVAFAVIENPITIGRCLVNQFTPNVRTFYPEMAVPKAQVSRFFFANERVVLFRTREARSHQSNDHWPRVDYEVLVSTDRLSEDLTHLRPDRAAVPGGAFAQALLRFQIDAVNG